MRFAFVSCAHAVVIFAMGWLLASAAWAADTGNDPAREFTKPRAPPTAPLLVWIDDEAQAIDEASLRESLARELGRAVALSADPADAAVRIRLSGDARADVQYTTPGGQQLSRTVELPPDRRRAVQVVSWLTVNLVRDEASELLDELRARRKEEAEARATEQAALEAAAADRAAADKAAADKAAADKAAADKAAADKAARLRAEQAAPSKPRDDLLRDPLRSVDAAVATPLSFLKDSPKRALHLQLALGYGESGAIEGVGVSPGVLRVRRDLLGVTVAAGAAFVGGNARGAIVSTGYAQLDGNLEGVLVGAGAAVQRGPSARGVVVAVGGALAGNLTGALVGAGFATSKSLHGVGVSAGVTVIRGRSEGVLIGAGANWSAAHRGVEASAGVNAGRDLDGIAVAPINVHRHVQGIQIGIINVAEDVDAAIGLISIAKNGRVQPVLWSSPLDGSVHLAIKSIAGLAFTQIGAGVDLTHERLSYDGGVGLHLRLSQAFFLEPGLHYAALLATPNASGAPTEQRFFYLAQLGWRVGNKLDLAAGGGLRHTVVGGSGAPLGPEARVGIAFF